MLQTALGDIQVFINGQLYNYNLIELPKSDEIFSVDERYKVLVDFGYITSDDFIIECKLVDPDGKQIKGFIESGEKLALISFYSGKIKLSIGIEDEMPGINCEYLDCGLKILISKQVKIRKLIFGIAWIFMQDKEKEDIYTWFAADPTLYSQTDKDA